MPTPVTILVKSFNRPYYLDRCLRSIYSQIQGRFDVIVLDDGTPPRYLDEIAGRFPQVRIERSELYAQKVAQLEAHAKNEGAFTMRVIPTKLWIDAAKAASEYFYLIEDDIWITQPFNISEVIDYMAQRHIVLTKSYWGGNDDGFHGRWGAKVNMVQEYEPTLPTGPEWWLTLLLHNKFKIQSILYRLRLSKEGIHFHLPFYGLYSVASAMFNKEYWLNLWEGGQPNADEVHQLARAFKWTRKRLARFAKTETQLTQTSFITSATGRFSTVEFDMIAFNYHMNEAWLASKFDVMKNYPLDLDEQSLRFILDEAADPRCTYENWQHWIVTFKETYRRMGVAVD
jgi:glycosyltransferase involved in cell wall biosynthesis